LIYTKTMKNYKKIINIPLQKMDFKPRRNKTFR
jgi:hypothetical protein